MTATDAHARTITATYGHRSWSAPPFTIHDDPVTQQVTSSESLCPVTEFSVQLSSTRRGARLARTLAVQQLTEWCGVPYDSDTAEAVALVTAELASNAITHGHLRGRDFRLTLLLLPDAFRIEVTDTRPERTPPPRPTLQPSPASDTTSGRGLLLVEEYADHWGYTVPDAYTKTVWAEVAQLPDTLAAAVHKSRSLRSRM